MSMSATVKIIFTGKFSFCTIYASQLRSEDLTSMACKDAFAQAVIRVCILRLNKTIPFSLGKGIQ